MTGGRCPSRGPEASCKTPQVKSSVRHRGSRSGARGGGGARVLYGGPRVRCDVGWSDVPSALRTGPSPLRTGPSHPRSVAPSDRRIERTIALMQRNSIRQTFTAALNALVEQIKQDRAILAAVLCGSLSHDTVWAKSDIDLVLVTIDDRKIENSGLSLNADGVNVHAVLMPRGEFRQVVEGSVNNSFFHSFLAKGRLLYTTDPSIEALCARLHTIGERDTQLELLRAGVSALPPIDKAHKWFVTRGDLDYTALWVLYAATH